MYSACLAQKGKTQEIEPGAIVQQRASNPARVAE